MHTSMLTVAGTSSGSRNVPIALKVHPELGCGRKETSQSPGQVIIDRSLPPDQPFNAFMSNVQLFGKGNRAHFGWCEVQFGKHVTGMRRMGQQGQDCPS